MNTSTKIELSVISIIGIGAAAWLYWKHKRPTEPQKNSKRSSHNIPIKKNENVALKAVSNEFVACADSFRGIYESLYNVANTPCSREVIFNVLSEWDIRMNNIPNIPTNLKMWWKTIAINIEALGEKQLRDKAAQILEMIDAAGIIRCNNPEEISLSYKCWYMNTTPVRIIEKIY